MNDQEFLAAFESDSFAPGQFHHCDHVRLAWLLARKYSTAEAVLHFTAGLRRFALAQGKADLYHETITYAYLLLICERARRDGAQTWEDFARANHDLLRWKPSILERYYLPGTLESSLAKAVFVFPDRGIADPSKGKDQA